VTPRDTAAQLSPNQLEKQRQIVEAAQLVLARDGLAGCTVRAIAEAGPLTKSAIHYYFADLDDLVDRAIAGHIRNFVTRIREAAAGHEDPRDRFWAGVEAYLDIFQNTPGAALLWFDYWIDASRKGRLESVAATQSECVGIFAELLAAIPVDDPEGRAGTLYSYLLGTIVQQTVQPRPFDEIKAQVATICPIDAR
jgi:AcrR family transcriptional regulator